MKNDLNKWFDIFHFYNVEFWSPLGNLYNKNQNEIRDENEYFNFFQDLTIRNSLHKIFKIDLVEGIENDLKKAT